MVVNGNEYKMPDVDYNAMCDLAKYGANLFSEDAVAPQALVRAFLALKLGSARKAGDEIQSHIAKHGLEDMASWAQEINDAISDGGFFSAARKAAKAAERKAKRAEERAAAKDEADATED